MKLLLLYKELRPLHDAPPGPVSVSSLGWAAPPLEDRSPLRAGSCAKRMTGYLF